MRIIEAVSELSTRRNFPKRIIKRLIYPLTTTRIVFKIVSLVIRKRANNCRTLDEYVSFPYDVSRFLMLHSLSIRPLQIYDEIVDLMSILARRKPKFILEIGTANGGTLFLWTRIADENAKIISIDLPGGPFGGGYPESKTALYRSFARYNQKIYLIRKDSHDISTFHTVKSILKNNNLDFLFIDGDHTYEGVKKDFEMYSKLVRKGGIIALHDIVHGSPEDVGEVPKFWEEVKNNFNNCYKEIVKNWSQGLCGIGVIFL